MSPTFVRAEVHVIAEAGIPEGEELCFSYVDTSWPREARRHALREGYGFDCDCRRCAEELGLEEAAAAAAAEAAEAEAGVESGAEHD